MAMQSSRLPPVSDSAQVWRQLDVHLRQQAVSVVAQMAFNVVRMQPASSPQESDDDHLTQRSQAPQ
jgi:hypothetical protein